MHYADTTTNDNGAAIAFCYCGWSETHPDAAAADAAAEQHQNTADTDPADGADDTDNGAR